MGKIKRFKRFECQSKALYGFNLLKCFEAVLKRFEVVFTPLKNVCDSKRFKTKICECQRFFTRNLLKMSAIADRKGQGLRPCRKDGLCPSAK